MWTSSTPFCVKASSNVAIARALFGASSVEHAPGNIREGGRNVEDVVDINGEESSRLCGVLSAASVSRGIEGKVEESRG